MSTLIRRVPERDVDLIALAGSHGYRVDDPDGRVGTVGRVVAGAWSDRPDAIEVRVGLFRPAVLVVGVSEIAAVDTARRRVLLGTAVDLADAYLPRPPHTPPAGPAERGQTPFGGSRAAAETGPLGRGTTSSWASRTRARAWSQGRDGQI